MLPTPIIMTGKVLNNNSTAFLVLILPLAAGIILLYKAWPILLVLLLLSMIWRVWDTYQWKQWCQQVNPFFNQLVKENQGCLTPMDLSLKTNLSGRSAKQFLERKAEEYGALRKDNGEQGIVYYFLTATALGSIFDESEPDVLSSPDASAVSVTESPPSTKKTENHSFLGQLKEITSEEPEDSPPLENPSSTFASLVELKEERQQQSPQSETVATEAVETEVTETAPPVPVESEADSPEDPLQKGLIQSDLAKRLDVTSSTLGRRKSDPDFGEWSQSKDPDGIPWQYIRRRKLFMPINPDQSSS